MLLTVQQPGQEDRAVGCPAGATLMEALALADIRLDAPCGGQGRCGKCQVEASGGLGEPSEAEKKKLGGREGFRLACLARVEGDAAVRLAAGGFFSAVKALGWSAPYSLDPPLRLIDVPERGRLEQECLLDTLGLSARPSAGLGNLARMEADKAPGWVLAWHDELLFASALENPDESDDDADGKAGGDSGKTRADAAGENKNSPAAGPAPAWLPRPRNLAAAFDLGTTGLAVAVLDLEKKAAVAMETSLNPQTSMGADVISRITAAAQSEGEILKLQSLALEGLGELAVRAAGRETARQIGAAVVSGNTTMLHLLAGINPRSLAQAPYRPVFTGSLDLSELAGRLNLAPYARVVTSPSISSFVGGDITSGLIAVKLADRPGTCVFIDIGTNGEIVVSKGGRLVATSCAAGPALEGMNISCGTRAVAGAVDGFRLNGDLSPSYTTIGQQKDGPPDPKPVGICGSGLVDVCSELVRAGLVSKTGRLLQPEGRPRVVVDGRYHLTEEVYLSQKDVRQVQLAKGAIAAAMKMLLNRLGLTMDDLDEVVVAGSFGFHLRPESLLGIGLIPGGYGGPVTFVGNSSLAGSARLLLDRSAQKEIETLARTVEVVELGFDPKFQDNFLAELRF